MTCKTALALLAASLLAGSPAFAQQDSPPNSASDAAAAGGGPGRATTPKSVQHKPKAKPKPATPAADRNADAAIAGGGGR